MLVEIVRELFSFILYCCATIAGSFIPLKNPSSPTNKTIIIVHGWMGRSLAHVAMKWYFESQGFCVYFADFGLHISDITTLAKKLHAFFQENTIEGAYLLGISDGGIICLEYLQTYNAWKHVKKFIALVTPFQGSWVSSFAFFSQAAQQIKVESPFIVSLKNKKTIVPEKLLTITGTWDEFVLPNATKISEVDSIIIPEGGHAYLQMFSKKVFEAILKGIS